MSINEWKSHFQEAEDTVKRFHNDPSQLEKCLKLSQTITKVIQNKGNLFCCGNGGSHAQAMHFAEEWTGRFMKNRPPVGAIALGDPTHLTCVGNDLGFDEVFSRQLDGLARNGDFVLFLSTSGNSPNLLKAVEVAKKKGLETAALLGRDGGKLLPLVDNAIVVDAQLSHRIQEVHIQIIHSAIDLAERAIFKV
ncbi:SIS domain-containing protein [bacterium]|nr:SIS domain-containing protein [bacterium]